MSYGQNDNLGKMIRSRRIAMSLTLQELATLSCVSSSYLGRVETGERFPSARILRKIAQPLGFEENELFSLAGYLSAPASGTAESNIANSYNRLDPYVAGVLSQETVEVQRAVTGVLSILKNMARSIPRE